MQPGGRAQEVEERRVGRLWRLAAQCPTCRSRPALRVTDQAIRDAAGHPPGERLATYQCQRQKCGTVYDLLAAAYHRAS